ncbi:MAG: glycine zipper family protein [Myxococcota bacterium]
MRWTLSLTLGLALAGCTHVPTGPSVMVLPGSGKSFDEFRLADAGCRQWAAGQIGVEPGQAVGERTVAGAAIGTGVGAASGALIGAATGDIGEGAAIGAGTGLLVGSAAGASQGGFVGASLQQRFDVAYMQCMYAEGHRIPVPYGAFAQTGPPSAPRRPDIPPPPAGPPPLPPPGP